MAFPRPDLAKRPGRDGTTRGTKASSFGTRRRGSSIMDDTTATSLAQPQPDRFLIGIGVGLAVLLLAAAISVAFLRQPAPDLPAATPGGTVQRFYRALEQKDYAAAYAYLSPSMSNKPTREDFTSYYVSGGGNISQQRIRIQDERVTGSDATVTVSATTFYNSGSPFGGSGDYTSTEIFTLRREDGTWRITHLPSEYIPFPVPTR
jgi:hypothetical protein